MIFFIFRCANLENRTLKHSADKFVMDPLHNSAQTSQNFPKMSTSDMEEVSLEEGFQHTPSSNALRNMLSTLPAIPKMLPMLLGLFCMKMYARDQSEEAASNQDIEPPMMHDAKTRSTHMPGNPHIFLVANPQTPSKRRVVIARPSNKWASSRLFSWIKHSVLGMPRTNLLG